MRILTWLFFATLSLILLLQLRGFDSDLRTPDTPNGIVGYELAWSAANAEPMIAAWRANDVIETAKVSLGVDFVFLVAYPLMFATGIGLLVRTPAIVKFDIVGARLARVVLLCIPLDAIENLVLWHMLNVGATNTLAHLATICASIKFLLVIVAAMWSVMALARRVAPFGPLRG